MNQLISLIISCILGFAGGAWYMQNKLSVAKEDAQVVVEKVVTEYKDVVKYKTKTIDHYVSSEPSTVIIDPGCPPYPNLNGLKKDWEKLNATGN